MTRAAFAYLTKFEKRREDTIAEIAHQPCEPSPSQHSAKIAHGVLAAYTRPISERRPRDKNRIGQIGRHRSHHHDLPACLTISDQHGLAVRIPVPLGDELDEMCLRTVDVCDRPARLRLWQKADEIAWVPRSQRDADLAVMLHPANARTVPSTRVEDNKWPLPWVDRNVGGWNDFHQDVIDGLWQRTAVD